VALTVGTSDLSRNFWKISNADFTKFWRRLARVVLLQFALRHCEAICRNIQVEKAED